MAHSIISDEINTGTLKDLTWALSHVIKCQQMYSISSNKNSLPRIRYKG